MKKQKLLAGYVYVLKSQELYKIGRAVNLTKRMYGYTLHNPFGIEIKLSKIVSDSKGVERKLHKLFQQKNVSGEWFSLSDADLEVIKIHLDTNGENLPSLKEKKNRKNKESKAIKISGRITQTLYQQVMNKCKTDGLNFSEALEQGFELYVNSK